MGENWREHLRELREEMLKARHLSYSTSTILFDLCNEDLDLTNAVLIRRRTTNHSISLTPLEMVEKLRWSKDHLPYILVNIDRNKQQKNAYLAEIEKEGKETKQDGTLENKAEPIYEVASKRNVAKLLKALKHCITQQNA